MKLLFLIILVLIAIILILTHFKRSDTFEDDKQKSFCEKSDKFLEKLEKYRDENLCD